MKKDSWIEKSMNQFWALLKESVIVQSIVTLVLVGVIGYLSVEGRLAELPKEFWMVAGTVIGHWFGSKGNIQLREQSREMMGEAITRIESCRPRDL